ncbi:hypothetical protein PSHT_04870 [Puccinia striiformis]|nr:hypothetical protein PSHT_04870 [Puccinia striiformis]
MYYLAREYSLLVVENTVEITLTLQDPTDNSQIGPAAPPMETARPAKRKQSARAALIYPWRLLTLKSTWLILAGSALVAIKESALLLKDIKNRRLVVSKASSQAVWDFKDASESLLIAVGSKSSRPFQHKRSQFPGVLVVRCLPRDEVDVLMIQIYEAGYKTLKKLEGLVSHKDHLKDLLPNVSVGDMEELKARCWAFLGTAEDSLPALSQKRQRRKGIQMGTLTCTYYLL